MDTENVLQPAESAEYISRYSKSVKIHQCGIEKLCQEMLVSLKSSKLEIPETGTNIQYPAKEDAHTVDWLFVADSLNFCFWSYSGAKKWTVDGQSGYYALEAALSRALKMLVSLKSSKLEIPETGTNIQYPAKEDAHTVDWLFVADSLNFCFWSYSGAKKWTVDGQSGYYALEAALSRALKEGVDITNPAFYSKITKDQLKDIMKGDNDTPIPLFKERLSVLHEVGAILLEKFNGTFTTCLKEADKSAVKLLKIIVDNFPCFRDVAVYNGQAVSLYKRAQILVADIWNFFGGKDWGEFHDIDEITMFADYRIPQVLAYFGVFTYSDDLMEKLKNDVLLPSGSEEEVEIRGCSIQAVELLKNKIEEKIKDRQDVKVPNSSLIDYYLWCYRRKYADELEKVPFHKTLGIFY